jgi:hypothetical protein
MPEKDKADKTERATERAASKGYREGTWANLPWFWCDDCPFDTHDEDRMKRHVADPNAPQA